jgi:hypothetical protein
MNSFGDLLKALAAKAPTDKTSTLLVEDLQKKPQTQEVLGIISNAKSFLYDDFKSSMPCPKVTLAAHLNAAGLHDLADNVINGTYD